MTDVHRVKTIFLGSETYDQHFAMKNSVLIDYFARSNFPIGRYIGIYLLRIGIWEKLTYVVQFPRSIVDGDDMRDTMSV